LTDGIAKNTIASIPMYNKNLPDCPKLVAPASHPVTTQFLLSIITNGCVVQKNNNKVRRMPMVWECFMSAKILKNS
jgi:hypothetical protein